MDLLEQPMEAVAFSIYSLPEVAAAAAAAWTCLAAVLAAAAAAGLWRLRSSTPADFTLAATNSLELDTTPSLMASTDAERSAERPPVPTTASSPAPSPKERYTAYFHDTSCVGCCGVESDDEDEEQNPEDDDGMHGPWEKDPFELEVVRSLVPVVATVSADAMWRYRSPRAALGGSVVRLWDQGAQWGLTAASPRRRAVTVSSF
jgi:hypothetical protein